MRLRQDLTQHLIVGEDALLKTGPVETATTTLHEGKGNEWRYSIANCKEKVFCLIQAKLFEQDSKIISAALFPASCCTNNDFALAVAGDEIVVQKNLKIGYIPSAKK